MDAQLKQRKPSDDSYNTKNGHSAQSDRGRNSSSSSSSSSSSPPLDTTPNSTPSPAEPDQKTACDSTALLMAIVNFDGLTVGNILKMNPRVLSEVKADSKHYRSALHELCVHYASFDMFDRPTAANIHFMDIFNTILAAGAKVNETDIKHKSCLHFICTARGNSDIIKFIHSIEGAHINAVDSNGQTALHIAVTQASIADITTLLELRVDPDLLDMHGYSALHVACKKNRNHEVIELLSNYCDINSQQRSQNHRGMTPLHAAVSQMAFSNVEALIAQRVRVNVKDSCGQTPLHIAASSDITGKIVAILLGSDANVNSQDELFKDTPLHKACKHNMINAICSLVDYKANIKIQNANKQSALHIAASTCRDQVVWSRLLHGLPYASINIPDYQMKTPLEISECQNNNIARSYIKLYE